MHIIKPLLTILTFPCLCAADVILTAHATNANVPVGGADIVTIVLADNGGPNSVGGFQFNLNFNAAALRATSVLEEGYFASNGVLGIFPTINNTAGTITGIYDAAGTPEDPGTGDTLVQITFHAVAAGTSPISITNDLVSDYLGNQIADTVANTTITVSTATPEPATTLLAGAGIAGAAIARRRLKK